ncbi:MAG: hypothetical protein QOI24_2420 [Acidobacteriota bacterium]|nr:hypothetical protein [Acidobacteriota bacterium]
MLLATEELVNVVEAELRLGHVSHERLPQREVSVYELVDFVKPDVHELVQTSFELVASRKEEAAAIFYGTLFELAPEAPPLFVKTDMRVQGEVLMNMIGAAVRGLDRLDELKPAFPSPPSRIPRDARDDSCCASNHGIKPLRAHADRDFPGRVSALLPLRRGSSRVPALRS